MQVTKNVNGSLTLSIVIGSQYVKHTYYGYTMKQAKIKFRQMLKEKHNTKVCA